MRYRVGSVIRYRTIADRMRTVVVTKKQRNVKNGRPGFEGRETTGTGNMVWGYDEGITQVIKY